LPVVEDLPVFLDRIHKMKRGDPRFGTLYYDRCENDPGIRELDKSPVSNNRGLLLILTCRFLDVVPVF